MHRYIIYCILFLSGDGALNAMSRSLALQRNSLLEYAQNQEDIELNIREKIEASEDDEKETYYIRTRREIFKENIHRLLAGKPPIRYVRYHQDRVSKDGITYIMQYQVPDIQLQRNELIVERNKKQRILQKTQRAAALYTVSSIALSIFIPLIMTNNGSLMNINFQTFLTQWNILFLLPLCCGIYKVPSHMAKECVKTRRIRSEIIALDATIDTYALKQITTEELDQQEKYQLLDTFMAIDTVEQASAASSTRTSLSEPSS